MTRFHSTPQSAASRRSRTRSISKVPTAETSRFAIPGSRIPAQTVPSRWMPAAWDCSSTAGIDQWRSVVAGGVGLVDGVFGAGAPPVFGGGVDVVGERTVTARAGGDLPTPVTLRARGPMAVGDEDGDADEDEDIPS